MSHDQPGQDEPGGGRDEFDHFFSDRRGSGGSTDPDTTAWADPAHADNDRTQASGHAPYVRPPQPQAQYDEYEPADRPGYYQPAAYYEEPPQRRGAMWAPVAVIVASLAIVAVVIAIILNNSSGKMAHGAFTPTATVTQTTTPKPSQSDSSSQSSSQSPSSSSSSSSSSSASSSSSSSSSDFATSLPGSAGSCSGSDSFGTGPKTSCDFAGVVSALYNAQKDKDGNASFDAKSPTTHDKYKVNCRADKYVTCTTETGAIVYILRK